MGKIKMSETAADVAAVILAAIVIVAVLVLVRIPTSVETGGTGGPDTIRLSSGENHFADVLVGAGGELSVTVLDSSAPADVASLQAALDDIRGMETLPLAFEPELGLFQVADIPKNDSRYVYAVADYIRMNCWFDTEFA